MTEGRTVTEDALPVILDAVRGHRLLSIDYTDASGTQSRREVEPRGLIIAPHGTYLIGWCRLRDEPRSFRVDRIAAARGLPLPPSAAHRGGMDELMAALDHPERLTGGPPVSGRDWTSRRIRAVRGRLAEVTADLRGTRLPAPRSGREPAPRGGRDPAPSLRVDGAAELRVTLSHLAEWTREHVAAIRAEAGGTAPVYDGYRPAYPRSYRTDLPFDARERMIADAMAFRSLGEVARDLDAVLEAAAHWCADLAPAAWEDPADEHARGLADQIGGWPGPLAHIEWHLDRLEDEPAPATGEQETVVDTCPMRPVE